MAKKKTHSEQTGNLHLRAEKLHQSNAPEAEVSRTYDEMQRLVHELEVHQIELELQNAELSQARDKVEITLKKYSDLYDIAPVAYLTLDHDGAVRAANLTAASLLGIERSRLLGCRFGLFVADDNRQFFSDFLGKVYASQGKESCEVLLTTESKSPFYVQIEAIVLGAGQECRIAVIDISERKRAVAAIRESEERFHDIVSVSADWVWEVDKDCNYVFVSGRIKDVLGYEAEEIIGRTPFDLMPPDEAEHVRNEFQAIAHRLESFRDLANDNLHKNGGIRHILTSGAPIIDAQGLFCGYRGVDKDDTERKNAEKSLFDSEERHQLATAVAKEAIWEVDFNTGTTRWNRAYTEIFNRPTDEHHHGEWWLQRIHPDDRERVNDKFSRAVAEGPDEWSDDYRMMRADGSYAFLQDRAIIVRDGAGKALSAVGAKLDITEQVEIAEALRESEERLRFALKNSRTGAWEMNLVDHTAFHSLEHARIFGYPEVLPNWTYKMFLEHVLPEDREMVDGNVRRAIESRNAWNLECRIRRTDGQVRWILTAGRHLHNVAGDPIRAAGIVQDITIRKLAEEEIVKLNTELEQRVADRTADLDHANEQLRQEIAERQQTENALRMANEEWLNTFNASTDPIMILDCNCRIRRANCSMAALLGMQIEECVGKFCYDQVHHTDAPIQSCPHNQMLKDGRPHTEEIFEEHIGKHLLVTVSPLFDANGKLIGSMHYIKDITAIKEAEQVLANAKSDLERMVTERTAELAQAHEQMKRVSFELIWAEEKERERIAGELHDQVGQALLLAKMKLDALEDKLSDDSLHTYAAEASSLIGTSIQDIRSLTFRMRPPILDTAGIETSLEWLCSSISNDYNLQVEYADDGQPKPLSTELRYSLYQAVRELLLNVVKHAGTETAQLSVKSDNHALIVQVADNGIGFNRPDAIMKHVHNGGYGLYNVRQRIEQMGGRFDVESKPGRGTSVTLSVPLTES